ncbi:hypothetical protein D3C72_2040320 [compost metagenome]
MCMGEAEADASELAAAVAVCLIRIMMGSSCAALCGPCENSSTLPPRGCWVCAPEVRDCAAVFGFWATRRGGMMISRSLVSVAAVELEAIAVAAGVGKGLEFDTFTGAGGEGAGVEHVERAIRARRSKAPAAARAR